MTMDGRKRRCCGRTRKSGATCVVLLSGTSFESSSSGWGNARTTASDSAVAPSGADLAKPTAGIKPGRRFLPFVGRTRAGLAGSVTGAEGSSAGQLYNTVCVPLTGAGVLCKGRPRPVVSSVGRRILGGAGC